MNVAVQGTKEFSDYNVFLRAMGVALSDVKDDEFNVYTVGPAQINSFTAEFCNRSENSLKQRGIKVRFYKVPSSYIEENVEYFDYFAFLSAPNQRPSKLTAAMELNGVEVGIFRY
jgi:predicted Fe-Mo cluster-binding NifX family protein